MKRALILFSLIVLVGSMMATTLNSPTVNGLILQDTGFDWESDEYMERQTFDGANYDLFITWDFSNLYIGINRSVADADNRFLNDDLDGISLFVAIDVNQVQGSGATSDGYATVTWNTGIYQPEYTFCFAGGPNWAEWNHWNGADWDWQGWSDSWGVYGTATGNEDDEIFIPWAMIGDPTGIALRAWITEESANNMEVLGTWPSENPLGEDPESPWAYQFYVPHIPGLLPCDEFSPGIVEHSLPVTLSAFNAVLTADDNVLLQWITESESDMHGYEVYRSETSDLSDAFDLGFVQAHNISTQQTYEYVDLDTQMDATYYYWLEARELGGSSNFFGPQAVTVQEGEEEEEDVPDASPVTTLMQNSPNPFNPTTTINYYIAEDSEVTLKIYNMKGQLINTLIDHQQRSGGDRLHSEVWESKDQPSGLYFYQLTVNDQTFTRKMLLLK